MWPCRQGAGGSSPLTRGKSSSSIVSRIIFGLIPAHAGKIYRQSDVNVENEAHPRSRGENPCSRAGRKTATGSSPLTRGKSPDREPSKPSARLIPAHAGKIGGCGLPAILPGAHPRSRGENTSAARSKLGQPGSSPLTRGKCLNRSLPELVHGLIPAHAGKMFNRKVERLVERAHPRSRGENKVSTL